MRCERLVPHRRHISRVRHGHSTRAGPNDRQPVKDRLVILYDRVLRHRKMTMDKSNTLLNINLNVPARSMKGILMLFENVAAQQPFARNTEAFYNPQKTKVEVTIEGIPNQLYSQGMRQSGRILDQQVLPVA